MLLTCNLFVDVKSLFFLGFQYDEGVGVRAIFFLSNRTYPSRVDLKYWKETSPDSVSDLVLHANGLELTPQIIKMLVIYFTINLDFDAVTLIFRLSMLIFYQSQESILSNYRKFLNQMMNSCVQNFCLRSSVIQ